MTPSWFGTRSGIPKSNKIGPSQVIERAFLFGVGPGGLRVGETADTSRENATGTNPIDVPHGIRMLYGFLAPLAYGGTVLKLDLAWSIGLLFYFCTV